MYLSALLFATAVLAAPQLPSAPATPLTPAPPGPIVKLSYGSYQGKTDQGVSSFLGIPFARPPIGNLRFRHAVVPPASVTGVQGESQPTFHHSG
jgi:hypothetical protein